MKAVVETEHQLNQWYASIPEAMKFPLDDNLVSLEDESKDQLRCRYLHCMEMIYRPFIFHIFSATPGTPAFDIAVSPPSIDYARKCLQVSVSSILSIRQDLRYEGTWYAVRLAFLAASLLLGAITLRNYVDLLPDRTEEAIDWAQSYLELWAPYSASTTQMLELLMEMKAEAARLEDLVMT